MTHLIIKGFTILTKFPKFKFQTNIRIQTPEEAIGSRMRRFPRSRRELREYDEEEESYRETQAYVQPEDETIYIVGPEGYQTRRHYGPRHERRFYRHRVEEEMPTIISHESAHKAIERSLPPEKAYRANKKLDELIIERGSPMEGTF